MLMRVGTACRGLTRVDDAGVRKIADPSERAVSLLLRVRVRDGRLVPDGSRSAVDPL